MFILPSVKFGLSRLTKFIDWWNLQLKKMFNGDFMAINAISKLADLASIDDIMYEL